MTGRVDLGRPSGPRVTLPNAHAASSICQAESIAARPRLGISPYSFFVPKSAKLRFTFASPVTCIRLRFDGEISMTLTQRIHAIQRLKQA
jgi:hypothetical protein